MSLNKVMLIGNAGKDPEVRYLENNGKVATFRLATTERYRDREGNIREITEWHTVVSWRSLADMVEKYVRKGSQLFVEGRLRTRAWNDRAGNTRYETEIAAENIQLLGRPQESRQNETGKTAPKPAPEPFRTQTTGQTAGIADGTALNIADDDLPF